MTHAELREWFIEKQREMNEEYAAKIAAETGLPVEFVLPRLAAAVERAQNAHLPTKLLLAEPVSGGIH